MKKVHIILALFFHAWAINAQIWRQEIYPVFLPPPNAQITTKGYDIQETNDGNYVFAGKIEILSPSSSSSQTILAKMDAATGVVLWQKMYHVFTTGGLQEVSLIEKPNGNLLLAGLENNSIYLIETDEDGDTIRTKRILSSCELTNGIDCNLNTIRLRATLDGNYIIGVGATGGAIGIPNPINQLIKIDSNHDVIWSKNYFRRFLMDFQPTSDGGYIMSGATSYSEPIIYKVDMNGDSVWQQNYTGQLMYDLNSIKETPDNGFVVTYNMSGFAGFSPFLMKVDNNGANILWQIPVSNYIGTAAHVDVDVNGNYIVTGQHNIPYGGMLSVMVDAAFVTKINPSGNILQTQVFDDLFHNSGTVVRYTSDGNFIVTGSRSVGLSTMDRGYIVKTGYLLTIPNIESSKTTVELFPNPLVSVSTLKLTQSYQELQVLIFDALGRQVESLQATNASQISIRKEGLESGVYFFKVLGNKELVGAGKLLIN